MPDLTQLIDGHFSLGTVHQPSRTTPNRTNRVRITDESILSRSVAARLDLPISQRMLNLNFKLSVVKRVWEDQLRFKSTRMNTSLETFLNMLNNSRR